MAALGARHTGEPVSTTNVQYVYPSSPSVAAITSLSAYFSTDCFPFLPVYLVSLGAGFLEVRCLELWEVGWKRVTTIFTIYH